MRDMDERWRPRPLLDENPWSLLRSVGLRQRTAHIVLLGWVIAVAAALAIHKPLSWGYAGVGFMGLLMLRYILQRLQGVPAEFTGPGEAITEDWSFQIRLAADVASILFFALIVATLVFGFAAIKSLIP